MTDPTQIPFLIKLIDDDSEKVRRAVADALIAFGSPLETMLTQLEKPLEKNQIQRMEALLKDYTPSTPSPTDKMENGVRFQPGQLVQHKRYKYRGVIVAFDSTCEAEEDWYLANQTQPDRNQPWYHVLVHDSEQVTYVAQTNLEADDQKMRVDHPLISHFFCDFQEGHYTRNDTAWPGE